MCVSVCMYVGFIGGTSGKEPKCRMWRNRLGLDGWVGKISWRRAWLRAPVFLPGEAHEQRSLVSYKPYCKESDITEAT